MKIQIIKLEKHDDVVSTQDKLAWGKTARLLLVLPEDGKILTRRIDLVILQRYCEAQGSQLGLVSRDALVKENARILGLPVFSSETRALKERWGKRKPGRIHIPHPVPDLRSIGEDIKSSFRQQPGFGKTERRTSAWIRVFFFTAGIVSVLALAVVFFPGAAVDLSPATQTQAVTLSIMASTQISSVNISGSLPARTISTVVEAQDKTLVTGSSLIADQYAFGVAQFTNLGDQGVNIPAGTLLDDVERSDTRFITSEDGAVEGGIGKTSSIPIRALLPGSGGNLPTGAIVAIEGPLGLQASVSNLSPTVGGTDKLAPVVSAKDYDSLHSRMVANLQQNAYQQIASKLNPGDLLIQNTLKPDNILDEESSPGINQPADYLSMTLRMEFSALYISSEDLALLGTKNLDANLGHDFRPVAGSLHIETVDIPHASSDQTIQGKIRASRLIQLILPEDQVTGAIMGLSPSEASQKLIKAYSLATPPSIRITPGWWPQIPILAFRISIHQGFYANPGS